MSVDEKAQRLSNGGSDIKQSTHYALVQRAMNTLPGFADAVAAQMRWSKGREVMDNISHMEALRQYFDRHPELEQAYHAVLSTEPDLLDGGNYFGAP